MVHIKNEGEKRKGSPSSLPETNVAVCAGTKRGGEEKRTEKIEENRLSPGGIRRTQ